ncbi:hypothetical protein LX32DRAFT_606626, partial [Colletotrichum zoysiae]
KLIPILKVLEKEVISILKDRINKGILKYSYTAYRNPFFLIKKKDSKIYLINLVTKINSIIIYNATLLLGTNKFLKDFIIY